MSTQSVEQRRSFTFGVVFVVLAIFTALEIAIGYFPALPQNIKLAVLIFLAVVKVGLVLLYFMHLRFDSNIFALPFALGLVLVVPIALIIGFTANREPLHEQEIPLNMTGTVIDVEEVSFQIRMSQTTAPAGPITFHVVNEADDVLHEFIIIKTDTPAEELPTNMMGRVEEEAVTIMTAAEDIPPANSRNLTVNLDAGHYVMICNLPGHYLQGMRVDFTVTGTSSEEPSTPESVPEATSEATAMPEMTATP